MSDTAPANPVRIVDVIYESQAICGDCRHSTPLIRAPFMTHCAKVGRLVAHSRPVGECPSYKAKEVRDGTG